MTPRAELNREAVGEFRVEGCGQEITGVVHLWLNILQHVQQGLHLGPFLGKLRRGGDEVLPGLGEVAVSVGPLWQHEGNEPREWRVRVRRGCKSAWVTRIETQSTHRLF